MDVKALTALGAEVVSGSVSLHHVLLGRLLTDGTVMMFPEGQEYLDRIRTVEVEAPATRTRGRKTAIVSDDDAMAALGE